MVMKIRKLGMVLEGPLSHDGMNFLYSEGEGYYIDSIARFYDEIVLYAYVLRAGQTYYDTSAHYRFKSSNIRVVELPLRGENRYALLAKLAQLRGTWTTIRRNLASVDAMYIFLPGYPGALATRLCRKFKKPYGLYLASDWPEEAALLIPFRGLIGRILAPLYALATRRIQDAAVKGAKFVLTAGKLLHDHYSKKSNTPIIETIPRINWPAYRVYDRTDTCTGDVTHLLFVGYLLERKGARYFIDSVRILRDRGVNVAGTIIGTGVEEDNLRGHIAALSLSDHITMMGHVANGEPLVAEYRKADIYIFTSYAGEGFPRVLYEAMSQGLPVICSDVCGISQKLVPDTHAVFVPPQDANAIADRVQYIINTPDQRRSLIKGGHDFMRRLIDGGDGGHQLKDLCDKYIEQRTG